MDESPMYRLPEDALHLLFSSLPLHQIVICRSVCKFFNQLLTSPHFIELITTKPLYLVAEMRCKCPEHPLNQLLGCRTPHKCYYHSSQSLNVFNLEKKRWFKLSLNFLPFRSLNPVASSHGLVYVWAESLDSSTSNKFLVVCNPLTHRFRVFPQIGEAAYTVNEFVSVDSMNRVMVLRDDVSFYISGNSNNWLRFLSKLPAAPSSPVLVLDSVYALFMVPSTYWMPRMKLFTRNLNTSQTWTPLETPQSDIVFGIVILPHLFRGIGNEILMAGKVRGVKNQMLMSDALESQFTLNSTGTIVILSLDLDTLVWDQLDQMPDEMFKYFNEYGKVELSSTVCKISFYAKEIGKWALWEYSGGHGEWRLMDCDPGNGGAAVRPGFLFEGSLTASP